MGLRIATNVASQAVQKNLAVTSRSEEKELEKLSSGKRITRASDDAAGMSIAKNLESQIKGLRQATRNANDGISLIQTAEGGLNEVSNILTRLRELTIQSSSDTIGETERGYLDQEYQQLTQEVDRIVESTSFNGTKLLNGEGNDSLDFQVGTYAGEFNRITFDASGTNASSSNLGISGTGISSKDDALDSIASIDEAINISNGQRANLGSVQSRLQSTVANLEVQTLNQDSARSVIQDVDVAQAAASLASSQVLRNAGIATLGQANSLPTSALRLLN